MDIIRYDCRSYQNIHIHYYYTTQQYQIVVIYTLFITLLRGFVLAVLLAYLVVLAVTLA